MTLDLIFSSNRQFAVCDYLQSHNQLLIRSSKNDDIESNIDIIFFGIKYIQLETYCNGLIISYIKEKDFKAISHFTFPDLVDIDNVFEIKSGDKSFYVVCAFLKVFENKLEFKETSLGIAEYKGRDKEIASSTS